MFFNRNKTDKKPSFGFEEIKKISEMVLPATGFFKSSDGVDLSYYSYEPVSAGKTDGAVIFIHGGGAGYQKLAEDLSTKHNIAVYFMDIRGHGNSGGPRGDSPSIGQVQLDLKFFIQFVKGKNPDVPLFLAGHSSGGALVLNYLTWNSDKNLKGYVFISPELGYKSKIARKDRVDFAKVKIAVFIKNAMTGGRFGHEKAVI